MRSLSAFILIAISIASLRTAYAQPASERVEPVEVFPDYITRRILADAPDQAISEIALSGNVARGVIFGAKRWDAGVPISVCFFGGSREVRRRIVATANIWEAQGAPVIFDFGDRADPNLCRPNRTYDIRVGYSQPGYWSMIGQDSLVHVGQLEQSMNFQHFDISPPEETEFRRVVLHEFGHALGFYHEHQQEDEGCDNEFNWPAVYGYLEGPPNNWSQETVDLNLRSRRYTRGDIKGDFNVKSIMLYTFPINFYRDGARNRCYSPGNSAISPGDAKLLQIAYGAGSITRASSTAAITAAATSFSVPEQAALNTRLKLFNADQKTKNQILQLGSAKFIDVDIQACSLTPETIDFVQTVTQFLSVEPKVGMLRYRGMIARQDNEPGITVFADADHPEIADARRIVASLSSRFGQQVRLAESPGRTRWLLTIVVCGRVKS